MPLTLKETETVGGASVFPCDIGHSALLEPGYTSTGAPAADATIALGWKPTGTASAPLNDVTGHYALTIRKVGGAIGVWKGATELAAYGGPAGATYAELVSNVLAWYCGAEEGYCSRLVIVEDVLAWSSFWAVSDMVTGLFAPRSLYGLAPHTLLDFSNGAALGEDVSGNGNDWAITGTQTVDTPTNNACTLNSLDPNAGTLGNGNLTLASGTARPTLQPESGKWSYKKGGVEQLYDADVSGKFEPDLTPGDYVFTGYAPASGYNLITAGNLPAPAVLKSARVADILLREGAGAETSITSLEFPPDFVNGKDRDNPRSWALFDSGRGGTKYISTDSSNTEATDSQALKSFGPSGYTLGASGVMNANGASFLDLCLKAGAAQGFEIVPYAGNSVAGRQIGHGLGKAPTFMIVKNLTNANAWIIYHTALGASKCLFFTTEGARAASWPWNDTAPTSTHFVVGGDINVNASGHEYVAYLFTDSDIFKAFSFTGNGAADGPFVNLGGRPLGIPFGKNSDDGTASWFSMDSVRSPLNAMAAVVFPNLANQENATVEMMFASQGFKPASTWTGFNGNNDLIVGLAVIESSGKYANAF